MKSGIKKLISFDTSTKSTGFAVYEFQSFFEKECMDPYQKPIRHGVIQFDEENIDDRVNLMLAGILYRLNEERPSHIVVEKSLFKKDPQALIYASEILGAIRMWAVLFGADYVEYVPQRWRSLRKQEGEKIP